MNTEVRRRATELLESATCIYNEVHAQTVLERKPCELEMRTLLSDLRIKLTALENEL